MPRDGEYSDKLETLLEECVEPCPRKRLTPTGLYNAVKRYVESIFNGTIPPIGFRGLAS